MKSYTCLKVLSEIDWQNKKAVKRWGALSYDGMKAYLPELHTTWSSSQNTERTLGVAHGQTNSASNVDWTHYSEIINVRD